MKHLFIALIFLSSYSFCEAQVCPPRGQKINQDSIELFNKENLKVLLTRSNKEVKIAVLDSSYKEIENPDTSLKVKMNYKNGELNSVFCVYHGSIEGKKVEFFQNTFFRKNRVRSIIPFKNGMKDGVLIDVNPNGRVWRRIDFMMDMKHGKDIMFAYYGCRILVCDLYDSGVLHGGQQVFYRNGQLSSYTNYENGKAEGVAYWYKRNGNIKYKRWYRDGKMIKEEKY